MSDEQLAIPRFKNWVKPATVLEALERCVEHARDERKWSSNAWFVINDDITIDYEWNSHEITPESHERVTKWIEGQTCTDVKACAAGIIAIETLDGAALYEFLRRGEELSKDFLSQDPIAWGAVERVAQAFAEEFAEEEALFNNHSRYNNDPVGRIVHHNDRMYRQPYRPDEELHHDRIVRCFERAVELEREQA